MVLWGGCSGKVSVPDTREREKRMDISAEITDSLI